jgi:uncharacterized membrane protein
MNNSFGVIAAIIHGGIVTLGFIVIASCGFGIVLIALAIHVVSSPLSVIIICAIALYLRKSNHRKGKHEKDQRLDSISVQRGSYSRVHSGKHRRIAARI